MNGSKAIVGEGLGIADRAGEDEDAGFLASMWRRLLQSALRLRADISFAVVDIFIIDHHHLVHPPHITFTSQTIIDSSNKANRANGQIGRN